MRDPIGGLVEGWDITSGETGGDIPHLLVILDQLRAAKHSNDHTCVTTSELEEADGANLNGLVVPRELGERVFESFPVVLRGELVREVREWRIVDSAEQWILAEISPRCDDLLVELRRNHRAYGLQLAPPWWTLKPQRLRGKSLAQADDGAGFESLRTNGKCRDDALAPCVPSGVLGAIHRAQDAGRRIAEDVGPFSGVRGAPGSNMR